MRMLCGANAAPSRASRDGTHGGDLAKRCFGRIDEFVFPDVAPEVDACTIR